MKAHAKSIEVIGPAGRFISIGIDTNIRETVNLAVAQLRELRNSIELENQTFSAAQTTEGDNFQFDHQSSDAHPMDLPTVGLNNNCTSDGFEDEIAELLQQWY